MATDPEVTRAVTSFTNVRSLLHHEGYRGLAHKILVDEGLDDPELILELENIVKEYQAYVKQRDDAQKLAEREAKRK